MTSPLKIAFYAGSCIPIHAYTLNDRPLGGTETALIRVAAALEARGHEVTVFTSHKVPPISKPRYLPAAQVYQHGRFDLLVLVQEWKGALFNLPAARLWFWTGDGPEQFSNYGFGDKRVVDKIERFIAVSNYHADSLCKESGFPREKASVVGNGVHLEYFAGSETRSRKRLIFTSAPYRGLELVPSLLLEILKTHPDIEFHGYTGMSLYDREKPFEGPHVANFREVASVLEKIKCATLHGNVTQAALAREYMKSTIFFYPATVPETCCITALEAQAAGCSIITSNIGALAETTGSAGIVVGGTPGSKPFMDGFVAAANKLLSDDALFHSTSEAGIAHASKELSWERVTDRFEALL